MDQSPAQVPEARRQAKALQTTPSSAASIRNKIEGAGLGLADTEDICKRIILHNEDTPIIDTSSPEHIELLQKLYVMRKDKTGINTETPEGFNHGRTEVINHVKAYQYMLGHVVHKNQPLSEELILETHRILCSDTPIYSKPDKNSAVAVTPDPAYAGRYRTVHVSAGTTNFASPKYVPAMMSRLAEDMTAAMNRASSSSINSSDDDDGAVIDPFATAANYSYDFVQIHPFRDGNGRMCRIILNTLWCKYAGIVVPIDETAEDHEEYIRIKRRVGSEAADHGEYAVSVLHKTWVGFRAVTKTLRAQKWETGRVLVRI